MSWGAVAVGAGTAVLGYMGQQQAAGSQEAANRQNVALTREQLDEQARQFDVRQLEDERRFELDRGLEAERYQQKYGQGGLSQSMRGYAGEQLGGYNQAGQAATRQMQALLGMGSPEEQAAAQGAIQESPGQKFIRERQQKALLRGSAATGGLGGGRVLTALQEQGTGFAQQDLQNQFSRLQALSGQGLSAGQSMVGKDIGVIGGEGEQEYYGGPADGKDIGVIGGGGARVGEGEQEYYGGPADTRGGGGGPSIRGGGSPAVPQGTLTAMNATKAAREQALFDRDLRAGEGFNARYAAAQKASEAQRQQQAMEQQRRMSEFG